MTHTINPSTELATLISRLQRKPNEDFLPLANSPQRFMDFLYFLRRQPACTAHKSVLADKFGITGRQVQFYSRAGEEIFDLFDTSDRGYVKLSALGKEMAYTKKEDVQIYLKSEMQKLPLIQQFINADLSEDLTPVIEAIEANEKWEKEYSLSSVERRASTIKSWVEFVRDNSVPVSESQLVQFVKANRSILSHLFTVKQAG